MKTGLFGGTFDPIHYGHVSLARQLKQQLGLYEVWFLVTPQNPWKQNTVLSDDNHRLKMVEIAIRDVEGLVASDYEYHLEKPSYTYQTLRHLREDYPDRDFVLLIGADNWVDFHKWSHPEEILENHHIGIFPREGYTIDKGSFQPMGQCNPRGVTFVDAELLPVSSTEVRRRIREGEAIRDLVTHEVEDYIRSHKMYIAE